MASFANEKMPVARANYNVVHTLTAVLDRTDRGPSFGFLSDLCRHCDVASLSTNWTFWIVSLHWPPHKRGRLFCDYFSTPRWVSCELGLWPSVAVFAVDSFGPWGWEDKKRYFLIIKKKKFYAFTDRAKFFLGLSNSENRSKVN